MIFLLYPAILLLYGEFSEDDATRSVARVLLYTWCFSVIFPSELFSGNTQTLVSGFTLIAGFFYGLSKSVNTISKVGFCIASFCCLLNTATLYTGDYTLVNLLPLYAEYSNYLIREPILLGVATLAVWGNRSYRDIHLNFYVAMLLVIENI